MGNFGCAVSRVVVKHVNDSLWQHFLEVIDNFYNGMLFVVAR
jgi:hypothetical protein